MGRNDGLINPTELRKAIAQLHPNGELFEVRIIDNMDLRGTNVYITLNSLNDALYSRQQADRFLQAKTTTSDKEVDGYDWLFLDFDPVRLSGISSTDEELKLSMDLAQTVHYWV